MRNIRTPEEWHALFDEQQRSGLNKTQFCHQHGITRSAFSNARHRLSVSSKSARSFVPALPPGAFTDTLVPSASLSNDKPVPRETVSSVPQASRQLALILPGATLSLPVDFSPHWLATLLREMAS
ncbi:IS66 family insertion sequence element accessory protein TnpA [Hafnia alvei]|uniref:IS66 family insertion sequence element accessory protein TnpA n=1 Tax=Hafnia TaxID=568 RepID=UPI0011EFFE3B|nr:hypothetical protein [Hafnia alvei]KAA0260914.1 hypothetical protein ERL64_17770 [Hafnia alvei]